MTTIYDEKEMCKTIHINSKKDLPEIEGAYFVNRSGFLSVLYFKGDFSEMLWLKEVRWYIQPIDIKT